MSKKDYIKLAQALKDSKPTVGRDTFETEYGICVWNNTVETIAMTLQHDNPRFNKAHFLHVCGYQD